MATSGITSAQNVQGLSLIKTTPRIMTVVVFGFFLKEGRLDQTVYEPLLQSNTPSIYVKFTDGTVLIVII